MPIESVGAAFNAGAAQIAIDDRMTLAACSPAEATHAALCRYRFGRGGWAEVLASKDAPRTKAILLRWTGRWIATADVNFAEAVFLGLCSPGGSEAERGDIARQTVAALQSPHAPGTIVEIPFHDVTFGIQSEPEHMVSLYIVDGAEH